jgi:spore germination protein YaaH
MNRPSYRLSAGALAFLLFLGASPVSAADPTASPLPSATAGIETPVEQPTIHAEMLAAEADATYSFEAGAQPEPIAAPAPSVQAAGGMGGIAALPNGLSHEVFGYLPYWALSSSLRQYLRYDLVSSIAYFSVPVNSDGTISTTGTGWSGWVSADLTDVINRAHQRGVRVVMTATMMAWNGDYSAMSTLLNSSTNRQRLATALAAAVKARNADGINLDFEPVPNSLQSQYTTFVRQVKASLVAAGAGSYLTVAVTGGAASWDEGFDLPGLTASGAADALMVMGYDFNWSGSAYAGGVAPLDSARVLDVRDAMSAFTRTVSAAKIIWGVPYYGRAWTTTSDSQNSRTCVSAGTCRAASWAPRFVDALDEIATHGRRWDATGQVPWYTFWSGTYGTYVQGYYDDAQSLDAKYSLVEASGLRGVGIWHLLMDVSRTDLWNELRDHFGDLPFSDIGSSPFIADILWIAEAGITNGCGNGQYCPSATVTRDQMASFIARALSLPAATADYFPDDAGTIFEADINRLAQAGITNGCGNGLYCPSQAVTRDQMASFIARALSLPAATTDYFSDDAGSIHEANINRLAAAGISNGCAGGVYCPLDAVTREQMAAFLHRALD